MTIAQQQVIYIIFYNQLSTSPVQRSTILGKYIMMVRHHPTQDIHIQLLIQDKQKL